MAARERVARAAKLDAVGAKAVDVARAAAVEVAGADHVGDHLGVVAEDDRVTVHRFATTHPGYRGWAWTVVLARVPRARVVTVSEVVLLPGDGALLAPSWVPWADRVEPGDLGETDVLPFRDDDPLLDEGFEAVPDGWDQAFSGEETTLVWELGLGRRRVLNRDGRLEAATRWYPSDNGPDNAETRAADAPCSTCGYLVGLTGSLRTSFGVCANAWSPDDGRVVSMDHGCGAHSETGQTAEEAEEPDLPLVDDLRQELDTTPLPRGPRRAVPAADEPRPEPTPQPEAGATTSRAGPTVEPGAGPCRAGGPEPVVEPAVRAGRPSPPRAGRRSADGRASRRVEAPDPRRRSSTCRPDGGARRGPTAAPTSPSAPVTTPRRPPTAEAGGAGRPASRPGRPRAATAVQVHQRVVGQPVAGNEQRDQRDRPGELPSRSGRHGSVAAAP